MTPIEEFVSQKSKGWSIFKITNLNPKQKGKKRSYYFVTSQFTEEEDVRTRVRAMLKSSTVRGGIKTIASDMAHDQAYENHFGVRRVAKGLSRERAMELREKLKGRTPKKMIYNKPR